MKVSLRRDWSGRSVLANGKCPKIQDPENHTLRSWDRGGGGLEGITPALSPYVGTGFLVCIRKFLFYLKTKGDFVPILVTEGKYFRNISFLRKVSKKIKQNL